MSEKLKPCPFCWGEAELAIVKLWIHVCCKSCHARTTMYSSKEQAIEAWNKRPNPWHTGTPTEIKGWYLLKYKWNGDIRYITMQDPAITFFADIRTIGWQKIEPYKETD